MNAGALSRLGRRAACIFLVDSFRYGNIHLFVVGGCMQRSVMKNPQRVSRRAGRSFLSLYRLHGLNLFSPLLWLILFLLISAVSQVDRATNDSVKMTLPDTSVPLT